MSINDDDLKFQKIVMEGLVPKVNESAVAVCIVPEGEELWVDAHFAVQLGVMIMLDKPIIAVVQPGTKVSEKLRLVADEIVDVDITTPRGRDDMALAIAAFAERFR